ncbi:site-specific integrase [Dehalococcoidales bacterium]|nr:site-specific integrase [Dehalococcoidales bacterium]
MPRSSKSLVSAKSMLPRAMRIVPYLTPKEVYQIADAARDNGRNGERDSLLILYLFETGLKISEALSLTPRSIGQYDGKPVIYIKGEGRRPRMVACPENLAHRLKSYAYSKQIGLDDRIFDINRKRAWQIIKTAGEKAGIQKRVWPHLFRHSDAIERLRQTGNPKALQHHLGHSSTLMTMRYLSTLTAEDALKIQQEVKFDK